MNICHLRGHLHRAAVIFPESKTVKFILVTTEGSPADGKPKRVAYVPCVLFEATRELESALAQGSPQKHLWEMSGRIARSSFEGPSGERRFATEVIVDPTTLRRS